MGKITARSVFRGIRGFAVQAGWGLVTGSSWWERVVAAVVAGVAAVWGFIQDVPVVFIIPAALVTAAAALWVLDRLKGRQFGSLTKLRGYTKPSLDKPVATRDELASDVISGRTIFVRDMFAPGGDSVSNRIFNDCVFVGPAVIGPQGHCIFSGSNWGIQDPRHLREIWIEVPNKPRFFYGVLFWKDCTFQNCWFDEIGLIGTKPMIDEWMNAFKNPPPQAS